MPHHQDDTMHPDEEETGMTMGERLMQKGAERAQEQLQRNNLLFLLRQRGRVKSCRGRARGYQR